MKPKSPSRIPFDFVLDQLAPLLPRTRQMFGCHSVYVGEKIVLCLRDREDHPDANGVWMATSAEHHESLRKEFPSMRSVYILSGGKKETGWQMLPVEADDFEPSVFRLCELILHNDPRIGKIPQLKKKKHR